MQELHSLSTLQLVDLLAEHTTIITRMFAENNRGNEYEKQKLIVKAIQAEIDFRRNIADIPNTNVTTPPDFNL